MTVCALNLDEVDVAGDVEDVKTQSRASPRRNRARVGKVHAESEGDVRLMNHRRTKNLNESSRELLITGLRKNRFCWGLVDESLQTLIQHMEFFAFSCGDDIVREGEMGSYFFVLGSGQCEVTVQGQRVDGIAAGDSFGGIALMYHTTRSASVTAIGGVGAWGVDGCTFRRVLREHATKNHEETCKLLDQMHLFDGLASRKKEQVSKLALLTEVFEPGMAIARPNTVPAAVYVVKSGTLTVQDKDEKRSQDLVVGDCVGWRAVLYDEPEESLIVAHEKSELIGIGVKDLKETLGDDLSSYLIHSFVVAALRRTVVFSRLSLAQVHMLAHHCDTRKCPPGCRLGEDILAAVILEGDAKVISGEGDATALVRGQVYKSSALSAIEAEVSGGGRATSKELAQGNQRGDLLKVNSKTGSRLASLSRDQLRRALEALGFSVEDTDPLNYIRKALLVKKIPLFHDLSDSQLDGIVSRLQLRKIGAREKVFTEGDFGDALYIIVSGQAEVIIEGRHIRELAKGACFGERALLIEERRTATIQALDSELAVWRIDRQAFQAVVTEAMRNTLERSLNLQSTNVSLKALKHKRVIGVGSFGTVRLVEHKRTAFRYALKRIKKKEDSEIPDDILRECDLLKENRHPFLLHYVDKFVRDSSVYILTELVTGGQLLQIVEKTTTLSRKHAQFYIGSLILTLELLHDRNIAYRDLKPENVMLDQDGYIKLVDFGLSKKLDSSDRTYSLVGTPVYMAPEIISGNGYGTECDLWALGAMFYELVVGKVPFADGSDDIDAVFSAILYETLDFPTRYNDVAGKRVLTGLLTKDTDLRLGVSGWNDLKAQKYFKHGVKGDLFSMIIGREMPAPWVSGKEEFGNEEDIMEIADISDAEELGKDDPMDMGCRLLATFKRFDINGDNSIDREELGALLGALDAKTFNQEVCDALMKAIDVNGDGVVSYEEFVAWIMNDESSSDLRQAMREATELDIRS